MNPYISFRAHKPLTMHLLRSLKKVTCVYCGQEMLTLNQIEDFAKKASVLTGKKLSKFLTSYQTAMKPNEIYVTNLIKEAIKKNPHSNLQEVLEKMFPYHLKKLELQQGSVLNKVKEIAQNFSEKDRNITLAVIDKGFQSIKENANNKHFKNNKYINALYNLKIQFEDKKNHDKMMKMIISMPNTHTSLDAFVVKYSRSSSYQIAFRLLSPNQSTIEHLKPKSCGGTNEIQNLVLACGRDNSTRSSDPLETMTNLERYLPEYFRTLKKSLAKKIPVQDFKQVAQYITDVKSTIQTLLKRDLHIVDTSKSR